MTTLVTPFRVLAESTGTRGNAGVAGGLFRRVAGWLAEEIRYRRTLNELSALSDRELDDIGVTRAELAAVARRSARLA